MITKSRVTFFCESIPRTDHLADVTAEDPTADLFAQFCRNLLFQFDRKIRNAALRVKCTVWQNAIRGAGFDTTRTCATMIGDEGRIRFESEIQQNFGEQEIGAMFRVNETGILANPA